MTQGRATRLIEAGLWLKQTGDFDGAKRLFEQALQLEPDNTRAKALLEAKRPEPESRQAVVADASVPAPAAPPAASQQTAAGEPSRPSGVLRASAVKRSRWIALSASAVAVALGASLVVVLAMRGPEKSSGAPEGTAGAPGGAVASAALAKDVTAQALPPTILPSEDVDSGEPNVGGLKLRGVPAEARVMIDGRAVPNGASEQQLLTAGAHLLALDARGFAPYETNVEIAVGKVRVLEIALVALPEQPKGTVKIYCDPWCEVSVDGQSTEQNSPATLLLTAGKHVLRLANPAAGLARQLTVSLAEGEELKLSVKLEEDRTEPNESALSESDGGA